MSDLHLSHSVQEEGIEFSLARNGQHLPFNHWALEATSTSQAAVTKILTIMEELEIQPGDASVTLPHARVAALGNREAQLLGLPPLASLIVELNNEGTLSEQSFRVSYSWLKLNGQRVVGPQRRGCFISVGHEDYRLPFGLYELVQGIDIFNATPTTDPDQRYRAWAALQDVLPEDITNQVRTSHYLKDVRIAYAGAFSLEIVGDFGDLDFNPILHAAVTEPKPFVQDPETSPVLEEDRHEPSSLLPPARQEVFAESRFRRFSAARPTYALGAGWYVALAPAAQKALDVVRRMQDAPIRIRRDFARNPRAYLRNALGDEYEEAFIENLFIETNDYSQRVREIGLWQPKVLPWIVVPREPWLPPEVFGIQVAGKRIELSREDVVELIPAIEQSVADGRPFVHFGGHQIPANEETLESLAQIAAQVKAESEDPRSPTEDIPETEREPLQKPAERNVLLIEDNLEGVLFERVFDARKPALTTNLPNCLATNLKKHQLEGFHWLLESWQKGRPGVMLADDMGLGKTLQALVFLARLKQAMDDGQLKRAPFLVIAPVGLLSNWEAELDMHLLPPGLGVMTRAHGWNLKAMRIAGGGELDQGKAVLDIPSLAGSDWILTNYESIRDYQHSFGRIYFSVVVFDEVQKTKSPGTLVTEAAKAMQADFVVAMTGTPIENRLADLWCITDTVQPGLMGDLRWFSNTYEKDAQPERLKTLKKVLSEPSNDVPALMLRRMKDDHLEGLPEKTEIVLKQPMPQPQAAAYREAVASSRGSATRGRILQALQKLRVISLHPFIPGDLDDDDYIEASGRYSACFRVLDDIRNKGEKALIFLEFLEPQAHLATMLQRRYNLPRLPKRINGSVSGTERQQLVDEFQSDPEGFDVLLLSPRAGGVGVTLTAANHVIHLSRWWNPAVEDQCTDRVYRIGQDKKVHVYYPMAIFPDNPDYSFDERLNKLLLDKRELSREMLIPPSATSDDAQRLFDETVRR